MNNLMQKRPFIVGKDSYVKLERVPLAKGELQEEWLQKLLQNSPQLLPVAEIDAIYAPLVCIGREVATPAGNIDNLYISPKGYITIVETKLWRNPEARREVIGQIIDYAKELKQFSYEKLDKTVRSYNKKYFGKEINLFDTMVKHQLLSAEDETLFVDLVEKNLLNARFLLLIVGDGIRDGVWRMSEFFNATPHMLFNLGLVQLEVYQLSENEKLVVPNLLTKTVTVERGIFRIEQGNLLPVQREEKGSDDTPVKSKSRTTKEDFIKRLCGVDPHIHEEQVVRFFDDLSDLGYLIVPYNQHDLRVKYPLPGGGTYLNVIYFSADRAARAYKNRSTLENDLLKYGYSGEIARTFYKELEPYQNDNLGDPGTINHDLRKMLDSLDDVLLVFDRLRSNF